MTSIGLIGLGAAGFDPGPGALVIRSTIPTGAGLGSSAALCVALTRWIGPHAGVAAEAYREYATRLEDRFHGRSSGMDVAVVHEGRPILYRIGQPLVPVELARLPRFSFHDTGHRAKTQACVAQVERFRDCRPERGRELDAQMDAATQLIVAGLRQFQHDSEGLTRVAQGMRLSVECFMEWGLVPDSVIPLMAELEARGALATRLTGAGGGGMVVALWSDVHYKN